MINVIMKTSEGDVEIELNDEKAPLTVANFLKNSQVIYQVFLIHF